MAILATAYANMGQTAMRQQQATTPLLGRREAIAGAAGLMLANLPPGTALAQPAAGETARGTVFDADAGGRGIPGVMVSNGSDVVKTDGSGHWSLPIAPGDSVFVIKPAGWATAVDPATNLPRFAYAHAPDGTPNAGIYRFAPLAPTGALPASVDFALRRQDEKPRFDAILFTDPQPESLAEVGYIRDDVVAQTVGMQAAFGITHGDVMFDDLSFYGRYNRIVGTVGLPWYNCCGNHDMNLEAADNTYSRETFKRIFGARWHAFQYGEATFLILDNVEYLGTDPEKPLGFGKYRGCFGARQLAFVRNVLANVPRDQLVVVSFHIPLKTLAGGDPSVANVDTEDFLAAIGTHRNCVSFSGHTHTNEHHYLTAGDGTHHHHVLAAVSGSWWSGPFDPRGIPMALQTDGSPNGFHILSVDGTRYTTTLVPAHDPAREQMRIMLDAQVHALGREVMRDYHDGALLAGPISVDLARSTRVVVNFFDGGPRSKLEMAIGDGDALPMKQVERIDPLVAEVYARNPNTKKPWVTAGKSSHVWQAALPTDVTAGTHRLTVRAVDEYGRSHAASMVLEITA
jgi:C terminal of Calcineurin-like phosphoesterase/N terminal of Calcineurin-like phosphoesterase